jgi:hypothetical protein
MTEKAKDARRGVDNWAKQGTDLRVGALPAEALNLNVEGRSVASPIQGFGKMWQKTYRINIGDKATPREVIAVWKREFSEFWPKGNDFYGPLDGINPGDVALLNLTMPGRVKLSTGVLVLYADEESFTLMTPEGHMFAGWITFSAHEKEGTVAQAQVLVRASDPLYEIGFVMGGARKEDRFWEATLHALAARFEAEGRYETIFKCVDKKRQWKRVGNIKKNAAIRSGMYALGAPFRAIGRLFKGKSADPVAAAGSGDDAGMTEDR